MFSQCSKQMYNIFVVFRLSYHETHVTCMFLTICQAVEEFCELFIRDEYAMAKTKVDWSLQRLCRVIKFQL